MPVITPADAVRVASALTPFNECDSALVASADGDRDIAEPPCDVASPKLSPDLLTT